MSFLSAQAIADKKTLRIDCEIRNTTSNKLWVPDRPLGGHPGSVRQKRYASSPSGTWLVPSGELLVFVDGTCFIPPPDGNCPSPYAWPEPSETAIKPGAVYRFSFEFHLPVSYFSGGRTDGDRVKWAPPYSVRMTSRVWLYVGICWPVGPVKETRVDGTDAVDLTGRTQRAAEQLVFELPTPIPVADPTGVEYEGDHYANYARRQPTPAQKMASAGSR